MSNTANVHHLAYVGSKPIANRDSASWYTPAKYIESARTVLDGIGFDPFSSVEANKVVKAESFYTIKEDCFKTEWPLVNSCWMNPPYGIGICGQSADRFIEQFEAGRFKRGIVLTNNATDTKWFNALADKAVAMCFTDHRISFWNADGKAQSGNTRGQAFFYFDSESNSAKAFAEEFGQHGFVVKLMRGAK
jgi:hypothetical protein